MATRVRVKTTYAGPLGTARAGKVIELPDDQAEGLIAAGYAEAFVEPEPEAAAAEGGGGSGGDETATNDARETATMRGPRSRTGTSRSRTGAARPTPRRSPAPGSPANSGASGEETKEPED